MGRAFRVSRAPLSSSTLPSEAVTLPLVVPFLRYSFFLVGRKEVASMKTRLIALASTIVAVFYTAGAAWKF